MTEVLDTARPSAPTEADLVAAVQRVLQTSEEPLTLSKIRAQLPSAFRQMDLDQLANCLRRQVAANAFYQYPKYRSQQDRFWDRPMPVHIVALLRALLQEGSLPWSDLRRKLPAYAAAQAESIFQEELAQGRLHRHPRAGGRAPERFGLQPANPKDYLRAELPAVFLRLEKMGFTQTQLREAALELLHEEEWASTLSAELARTQRQAQQKTEAGAEASEPAARKMEPVASAAEAVEFPRPAEAALTSGQAGS